MSAVVKPQLFIIRGPHGKPEAIHQRTDIGPEDKAFVWWTTGPDGQPVASLQGRKAGTLPLYGSQHVAKWDTSRPVFVVEGEKACLALANAGQRALGTLGSSVTPGPGALAVLIGLHVALWPDNDAAGIKHMQKIASAIEGAVASLRWVTWPVAPAGGDAADYLAVGLRIEDLKLVPVPAPEPAPLLEFVPRHREKRRRRFATQESEIERFNNSVPVTLVLSRDYGLQTSPGKTVRCLWHDDKSPSLSILRDDRRAFCHSPACWAHNNGRGRDAWDLAGAATAMVAR